MVERKFSRPLPPKESKGPEGKKGKEKGMLRFREGVVSPSTSIDHPEFKKPAGFENFGRGMEKMNAGGAFTDDSRFGKSKKEENIQKDPVVLNLEEMEIAPLEGSDAVELNVDTKSSNEDFSKFGQPKEKIETSGKIGKGEVNLENIEVPLVTELNKGLRVDTNSSGGIEQEHPVVPGQEEESKKPGFFSIVRGWLGVKKS